VTLRRLALLCLPVALIGCDHATKHLAATRLAGSGEISLVPRILGLRYAENHDTAFGMLRAFDGAWKRGLLLSLAALGTLFAIGWWWRARNASPIRHAAHGMIVAGALGNVLDRAFRGHVVDFIHLSHWPIFNVADIVIVVGVALLGLDAWRRPVISHS
jgi:signal peptidase II